MKHTTTYRHTDTRSYRARQTAQRHANDSQPRFLLRYRHRCGGGAEVDMDRAVPCPLSHHGRRGAGHPVRRLRLPREWLAAETPWEWLRAHVQPSPSGRRVLWSSAFERGVVRCTARGTTGVLQWNYRRRMCSRNPCATGSLQLDLPTRYLFRPFHLNRRAASSFVPRLILCDVWANACACPCARARVGVRVHTRACVRAVRACARSVLHALVCACVHAAFVLFCVEWARARHAYASE